MANFIGDHICKVDSKGRILFPAALKKQLVNNAGHFVVKKDIYENCLVIYTAEEWNRQKADIQAQLNSFNKEHNQFLRKFFRGAAEIALDGNGRILIPKRLLEAVDIEKEIMLSGQDAKIEMWAKEVYDAMDEDDVDFAALAEKIMGNNKNGRE